MAQANADNLATPAALQDLDKQGLRAMLAQMDAMRSRIRSMLGEDTQMSTTTAVTTSIENKENTSISTPESVYIPPHKVDNPTDPVTEPTPPSTVDQAEGAMELD